MNWNRLRPVSLKTRVTLLTLVIFQLTLWALVLYAGQLLREDLERVIGEQQLSVVCIIADELDHQVRERFSALRIISNGIRPEEMDRPAKLQPHLDRRPFIQELFNFGLFIVGADGRVMARTPQAPEAIGLDLGDRDYVGAALKEGRATVGKPVANRFSQEPALAIAVPIRDATGAPIGLVAGAIKLKEPSFLDRITQHRYGATGHYYLGAPRHRLIVTASNPARIMAEVPPGVSAGIDRIVAGYEGTSRYVNTFGEEVLASSQRVPSADWIVHTSITTREAFAPLGEMQRRVLVMSLVATLVGGVILGWLLRRQLRPMADAVQTLAVLSASPRPMQPLAIAHDDEIGQLLTSFNRLLAVLAQREAALQESEFRWKFAIEGSGDGLWDWNLAEGSVFYSRRWKEMLGYAEDAIGSGIAEWEGRIHPDDKAVTLARLRDHLDGKLPLFHSEYRLLCQDGRYKWVLDRGLVIGRDPAGRPLRVIGSHHDITHRKGLEDYIEFRGQSLELVASGAPLREVLTFIVTGIERLKPDWRCGVLLLDAESQRLGQGVAPSLPDFYNAAIDGLAIGPGVGSCGTAAFTGQRVVVEDVSHHPFWAAFRDLTHRAELGACWSQPILGTSRKVLGTFAIYHRQPHRPSPDDLVLIERSASLTSIAIEREQALEEIRRLAYHDSLTKLPNRRLMSERLHLAMATSQRTGLPGALMVLDLDNFKPLNDEYGHAAGDLLLQEVARRLTDSLRETDTVARLGGDEFVAVVGGLDAEAARAADQALNIATHIATVLARPYRLSVNPDEASPTVIQHLCSASIGVALFVGKDISEQELIKRADMAMYQAKEAGRHTVRLFETTLFSPERPASNSQAGI